MLLYPHSFSGLPLLFSIAGSAIPRAVVPALVSMCLCLAIEESLSQEFLSHLFAHPYPYTVFANVVGFALVFRTNIAYNRYWEGIGHVRTMSTKWGDAALNVLSFDCHEKPPAVTTEAGQPTLSSSRTLFYASVCHRFSLLHALACAHLRREVRLRNFVTASVGPKKEHHRRPIKETAHRVDGCESLTQAFGFWRHDEFLASNPLSVLGGITDGERQILETLNSEARVASEYTRVLATINSRRAAGGIWVDPPTVSRIHQTLSDGSLGFYQACKLEDTPLPFPYAQMVSLVLYIFAATYPLLVRSASFSLEALPRVPSAVIRQWVSLYFIPASGLPWQASAKASGFEGVYAHWLAPSLSFVVTLCYFALHEVARELEDPFIHPPNEAPLVAMQAAFNTRLTSAWDALERMYALENVPEGMGGVGLRGVSFTGAESLAEAWSARFELEAPEASARRATESDGIALRGLGNRVEPSDAHVKLPAATQPRDTSTRWNQIVRAVN